MEPSIERMLFPTDLSQCSRKIAVWAEELGAVGVRKVGILFVINLNRISGVGAGIDVESYINSESERADSILPEIADAFEKAGMEVDIIKPYPAGDPVAEIIRNSEGYDFIAMGSRGRSIFKEILLGSVSEGVLRQSKLPVMVFKFKLEKKGDEVECVRREGDLFSNILLGYDFSEHSKAALEYAKLFAKRSGGRINVVFVREDDEEREIDGVVEEIKMEGIDAEAFVMRGTPHKVILKLADELRASTIFIGSRGVGSITSLILGSTSDTVIRRSDIPVFVCKSLSEVR